MVQYQRNKRANEQKNKINSLTVVIATFNRANSLKQCLNSLAGQTDAVFDILILDGGSSDRTLEVIDAYRKQLAIRVIVDPTPHLSRIRDRLWREAKGDIIASIDDDVTVSKDWVRSIKRAFRENTNLGGVTGPTTIPGTLLKNRDVFLFHTTNNPFLRIIGRVYIRLFMNGEYNAIGRIYPSGAWSPGSNFSASRKLPRPISVDYLEACNYAIPKTILSEIGGYDHGYIGTSEWCEVDVAFRIRKKGYRLFFDKNIAVEHRVSRSGVFHRRHAGRERLNNFARFYISSYFPKSVKGWALFSLYFLAFSFYTVILSFNRGKKHTDEE